MPPSGCPPQSNSGQPYSKLADPYYSNEDINILHQIIIQAEKILPEHTLPTKALFNAYYSILVQFNVDPDHDNRYARVLFKIGALRGPKTLFEKFEEVLSQMGIEIEFDTTEVEQTIHRTENLQVHHSEGDPTQYAPIPKLQRRNSESSIWDLPSRINAPNRTRFNSLSPDQSRAELKDTAQNPHDRSNLAESLPNPADSNAQGNSNLPNTGPWLDWVPQGRTIRRERSLLRHGSLRTLREPSRVVNRRAAPEELDPVEQYTLHKKTSTEEIIFHPTDNSIKDPVPAPETLLNFKVSLFANQRIALFIKNWLQDWKDQALQIRRDNIGLESISSSQYKKTLLHAVLHNWRIECHEKRTIRETEKYFEQLERRATRARDLYLLHVAFSHWSNFASEQLQQNALLQRHLIRTKIFYAWRDTTAIDDDKAQHHLLRRFFSTWIHRHQSLWRNNEKAVQVYESNLLKKFNHQLLRKSWARRASSWFSDRTKRMIFSRWTIKTSNIWQLRCSAEINRNHRLSGRGFRLWRRRTSTRLEQQGKALANHNQKISRNAILKWCKETGIIPAKKAIQTEVATRLLRDTFKAWLHRAREERRAAHTDRSKILCEALTNWRLCLRAQVTTVHINGRLMEQVLCRLIIEARSRLDCRLRNEALMQCAIHKWKLRWLTVRSHRWEQEAVAMETLARKRQNCVLLRWYGCMVLLQQCRLIAADFHRPQLLQSAMIELTDRYRHLQKLQQWAYDAKFYLMASKYLSRWKASTESVRREKRKSAYIKVRRIIKLNLARAVMQNWRTQAQKILDMKSRAVEVIDTYSVVARRDIFHRWRIRTEEIAKLRILCREKVLQKHLWAWQDQSRSIEALKTESLIVYQERQASRAIKKWSLVSLQARARQNYASDICFKNSKRHFRRIFNYWYHQTIQKLPARQDASKEFEKFQKSTARNDYWSELGDMKVKKEPTFDRAVSFTPMPGYLNTPSKKSERLLTAVTSRYSTTPRAPLSTPFEKELRALWSGGPVPSIRHKGLGRSRLGVSDIGNLSETPRNPVSKRAKSKSP